MHTITRPFAAAAAMSVAGVVLAMAPTGVARADSSGVELNPHLTASQRHNVRDIVSHLPLCQGDQPTGCKHVHQGAGHNVTQASFHADRRTYYVEVTYRHGHGKLTDVEIYR